MRKISVLLQSNLLLLLFLLYTPSLQSQIKTEEQKNHDLDLPSPIQYEAYYDLKTGNYIIYKKIGSLQIGQPVYMTPKEYGDFKLKQKIQDYYKEKSAILDKIARGEKVEDAVKNLFPALKIKSKLFETIFGGNKIELIPSGYASIDLGVLYQKIDNPQLLPQNRTNFTIDLQQRIKLSLLGKIGENLKLQVNYDTQAGFAFENKLNLAWKPGGISGGEDNIIKSIEFGNVNLPLSTSLIQGAEALFGFKTQLQFGRTKVTTVFSEQQSEARNIAVKGNGLVNNFKINISEYEDNQHYFLSQFFRNKYDGALINYPQILSNISITRLEVWKIDQSNSELQNQRAIIALRDLGENITSTTFPSNATNTLYDAVNNLSGIRDPITAYNSINNQILPTYTGINVNYNIGKEFSYTSKTRLLNTSEYTFHPQLGKISLNQRLDDNQLLAVAFEYTLNGSTQSYKVGEFANESNGVLITKLLKSNTSTNDTTSPLWNLMMKNIYSLNANQINKENFYLNVSYQDATNGKINYLPDTSVNNQQFIKLFNWDRLNLNGDIANNGQGDGIFDFVPNITIDPELGKIIFTKVEPFGSYLQSLGVSNEFIYSDLYSKQQSEVQQNKLYNKYFLEGRFKGLQESGIPLGALNVPKGSVRVTANGQELLEGVDYVVNYLLGRVTILNETIKNSGAAINISLENQSSFNQQKKRFAGLNIDHIINEKLKLGFTAINYQERPLTQKAQYGVEPVNNSIFGLNAQYNTEAPILTKFANLIPGIKTEQKSNLSVQIEAAYLLPGTNKSIDNQSYIDDFEETASKISLKDPNTWQLSSSNETGTGLAKGYKRGLMSWYFIDPRFFGIGGAKPEGITQNSVSQNLTRRVQVDEIYSKDFIAGEQLFMNTFDITFYPQTKGPYNNDTTAVETTNDLEKEERWGGLIRSLNVTNFQQAGIESIEFWMMDPYADQQTSQPNDFLGANPKLEINIGNISEDINSDGKLLYENGLSTPEIVKETQNTDWGVYPKVSPLIYTFESEGDSRRIQDAGYDGITSSNISNISGITEETIYNNTNNLNYNTLSGVKDPALDDYLVYNANDWGSEPDIRQRYKYYRNPEGNSPSGSIEAATSIPDAEDINRDYNLDLAENYNTYTLGLKKSDLVVGTNFIVDEKENDITFENGQTSKVKWYLVRIPLTQYDAGLGSVENLNNARFIRMFMKGFKTTSTLRFASLDLLRTDWRIYSKNIYPSSNINGEGVDEVSTNNVEIGAVDFETNGNSQPPYVLPPGINREVLQAQGGTQAQNEASMYLKINNLLTRNTDNASRGVFKNINLDVRRYKKLSLFVSAQDLDNINNTDYDPNMKYFIRLGTDLSDNYYEYEISLKYTPKGATSQLEIWPTENTIELNLDWFTNAKKERDLTNAPLLNRYDNYDTGDLENKRIIVKGRPSLGNITTIMMGARRSLNDISTTQRSIILWINELRLSGIDNEGGYAANAIINLNLADFAQIDATASYQSVGFGALNLGPSERSQEEIYQYNINTVVNLDKLMPKKWGIKLPIQYSTGERFINPKYNPLDNDIEFKDDPKKEELKKIVRSYSQQKTIAFPSIRKERTSNLKPRFYDVENLTFSFLYADEYYRDVYTKYNINQNLRTSLDYNFSFKGKYIQPFEKWKYVQDSMKISKYLQFVKEFNFNPIPTKISFRAEMLRTYNEFQLRDINSLLSGLENDFNSVYTHNFIFGWNYSVGFNLTKNLKLDINSATRTLVDDIGDNQPNQKLIWQNLTKVGRPINYNHTLQLNYRLPLEYIPYLDFITTEIGYNAKYDWTARSTVVNDPNLNLGNLAQNSKGLNINSNLDFTKIYNRFKSYRKYDSIKLRRQRQFDSVSRVYEANSKLKKPKKLKSFKYKSKYRTQDYLWMIISSLKRGQLDYTQTQGTSLPGFLGEPNFFGSSNINGNNAPTFGFLFGSQSDIRARAFNENWITRSEFLLEPYYQTAVENITASLQLEPIKDLKIDLNFLRNQQTSLSQSGYNTENNGFIGYRDGFENKLASFNSSIISVRTAFSNSDEIFNSIKENSFIISQRIAKNQDAALITNSNGYISGYDLTNAEVLIPSFYSAITGQNANSAKLGYKKGFPLPNWRLTYSGLKNIPWVNKKVSSIEISHGYTSTYTVNGVQSNLNYYNYINNNGNLNDLNGNRYNYYSYNTVSFMESFSPLLGINTTLRNSVQIRAEYNKDRITVLSLNNSTFQEDFSNEFILGVGYILKDIKVNLRYRGNIKTIKSDLNLRLDVSLRDNETKLRRLIENDVQITGGQNILSLKFSADYNFSKNLNLKLFYDQQVSKYKISTAFPLSTIRAGISATFQFGN